MIRTLLPIWLAILPGLMHGIAQAQAPVMVENAPGMYPEPIDLDAWVDQQPQSWSGGGYGYGAGYGYEDDGSWWPGLNDLNPFAPMQNDYLADAALNAPWSWQLLPDELIYRPELASLHTARLAISALSIKGFDPVGLPGGTNWYWDSRSVLAWESSGMAPPKEPILKDFSSTWRALFFRALTVVGVR